MEQPNAPTVPPVAIIIANYNNAEFVEGAIKSALEQTYTNYSVMITDDCSTDNSVEVIRSLCGKSRPVGEGEDFTLELFSERKVPIFLFLLKRNVGRGGVRNFSIDFALKNNYHLIQILDADDIMLPNKVSRLAGVIINDPETIGVAYGDYYIMRDGRATYESKPPFDFQQLANGHCMIHSGAMISSLLLKKAGYYRPDLAVAEDLNLWIRGCQHFLAYGVAEPLTIVRSHANDSTSSIPKEVWQRDFQRAVHNI